MRFVYLARMSPIDGQQKLFLIHCGFYDRKISKGIYEFHVDVPVVAESVEAAKAAIRQNAEFREHAMHIDGIREIKGVDGFEVVLRPTSNPSLTPTSE